MHLTETYPHAISVSWTSDSLSIFKDCWKYVQFFPSKGWRGRDQGSFVLSDEIIRFWFFEVRCEGCCEHMAIPFLVSSIYLVLHICHKSKCFISSTLWIYLWNPVRFTPVCGCCRGSLEPQSLKKVFVTLWLYFSSFLEFL